MAIVVEILRNVNNVMKCMILIIKKSIKNNFIKEQHANIVKNNLKIWKFKYMRKFVRGKQSFVNIVNLMYQLINTIYI